MDDRNGPAFPCKRMEDVPEYHSPDVTISSLVDYHGLTKRELFAAMAMQGLLAGSNQQVQVHTDEGVLILPARKAIPMLSLEYADALLAALNVEEPNNG